MDNLSHRHETEIIIGVLGSVGVGQSSLIDRFTTGISTDDYDPTIDRKYEKTLLIEEFNENVCLRFRDPSGQEDFLPTTDVRITQSDYFALVFDLTKHETFKSLEKIVKTINRGIDIDEINNKKILYIVGNKYDLIENNNKRDVTMDEITLFATQNNAKYIETSAKTGYNVMKLFESIAKYHLTRSSERIDEKPNIKAKCCPIL